MSLSEIEQEEQRIRDNALIASAHRNRNDKIAQIMDDAWGMTFTDIVQFDMFKKQAEADLDAVERDSIKKMSRRAAENFSNYTKMYRQSSMRWIKRVVTEKEVDFQQNETRRIYTNKFEGMANVGFSVEDILAEPSLDIIEKGMSPYWRVGELEKIREQTLVDALINTGRYGDAKDLIQSTKAFTSTERKSRLDYVKASEARAKREAAEQLNIMREQTMSTMTVDYWNGNLTDPQKVTDALEAGLIDRSDAEHLRNALINTEPPQTTYQAMIAVRYAVDGIAQGTYSREDALKVVIRYSNNLSPTDGKAFVKEIFGEQDTKNAFWKREAWDYIEKQILDVSTLTGISFGKGEQLVLSAQAHLAFDVALQDASKKGKPLEGRELLELAHEVMLPFRKKAKPIFEVKELPKTIRIIPKREKQRPAETEAQREKRHKVEFEKLPKLTLFDISEFLEGLTAEQRLNVYDEASKLKPIWGKLSEEEKVTAYQKLAEGFTAQDIIDHFKSKK